MKMTINEELLRCIPHQNVQWEMDPEKKFIILLKPKFSGRFLGKYLQPRISRPYYRINLDPVGTAVWQHINGNRTVKEIAALLKQELGNDVEPVYERLQQFMISLQRNKFILLQKP